MKGFVPTPRTTVDAMVAKLFSKGFPRKESRLLDPGCGQGAFIEGVLRYCRRKHAPVPEIVGVELDPAKLRDARRRLRGEPRVTLILGDFLTLQLPESFDYIVGNPPYVAIEELSQEERDRYRRRFRTARGRLDLYLLFWERALEVLRPGGRLVFITPEKFAYVETARPLREILSRLQVEEVFFAPEDTFPGLTTYPTITTVLHHAASEPTVVETRDGGRRAVRLTAGGESWQPLIQGAADLSGARTLEHLALRVSCGVATGADEMFVVDANRLPSNLMRFSRPTLAGRELGLGSSLSARRWRMLIPYDQEGRLLPEERLEALGEYLNRPEVRRRLEARTCAQRKPWYAFHETPPLPAILRPKLLCKDVTSEPFFWIDRKGDIVPRHSVYYIVPRASGFVKPLAEYLNSADVRSWLRSHCQRAANGFLRLQSNILKKVPVPDNLGQLIPPPALAVQRG